MIGGQLSHFSESQGFSGGSDGKESTCNVGDNVGFDPWVGKIPWNRKCQPNPVFLPGKFHGQRGLVGYSPQGCKELLDRAVSSCSRHGASNTLTFSESVKRR